MRVVGLLCAEGPLDEAISRHVARPGFAERAGQWQNDYSVDFKMAYNHYFGRQAKKT